MVSLPPKNLVTLFLVFYQCYHLFNVVIEISNLELHKLIYNTKKLLFCDNFVNNIITLPLKFLNYNT